MAPREQIHAYVSTQREKGATQGEVYAHLLGSRKSGAYLAELKFGAQDLSGHALVEAVLDTVNLVYSTGDPPRHQDLGGTAQELGIYSAQELWTEYQGRLRSPDGLPQLDLARWIASFKGRIRPLTPGDMLLVMADTGVGKSAVLQNLAVAHPGLPCLFFQIELSEHAIAERFQAIVHGMPQHEVEKSVLDGNDPLTTKAWDHIWTCPESSITINNIHDRILKAHKRMGVNPALVIVDYIGLVQGGKGGKYESVSTVAERMKTLAKATNTIIAIGSQVHRPWEGAKNKAAIGLHDAKDSGSLENSATVVFGLTRPQPSKLRIHILKDTRGTGGWTIDANYIGEKLRIEDDEWSNVGDDVYAR